VFPTRARVHVHELIKGSVDIRHRIGKKLQRAGSTISADLANPRACAMHSDDKPKPVAAMLDIFRESSPFRYARSFTCPVAGFVSFQKIQSSRAEVHSATDRQCLGKVSHLDSVPLAVCCSHSQRVRPAVPKQFPARTSLEFLDDLAAVSSSHFPRLLANFQFQRFAAGRVRANPNIDPTGLHVVFIIDIPQRERLRRK
jgi:hypothetical protein